MAKRTPKNVVGFDYESLDAKTQAALKRHAKAIHGLLRQTAQAVVNIGKRLIEVRETLDAKPFLAWIAVEFEWCQASAYNFMQAATTFGELDCLEQFQPSALVALSRQTIPKAAIKEAVAAAASGQTVSNSRAQELIEKHKRTKGIVSKPVELTRLRGVLTTLLNNVQDLVMALEQHEAESLADQLLELAMVLRKAATRTGPAPTKPAGRKRRRPENVAA